MKRIVMVLIAGMVFSFISCKKDHTCECTGLYSDGTSSTTTNYIILDKTKSEAKDECSELSTSFSNVTYTCEIK